MSAYHPPIHHAVHTPAPIVHHVAPVKHPAAVSSIVVPPIDKVPSAAARMERQGYCVNGIFTDLVGGQIALSAVVVYSRFYEGVGITCDDLPGYRFTNTYQGNYAYFVKV